MRIDALRRSLPPDLDFTPLLLGLCEYSEEVDVFLSCDFSLTESGQEDVRVGYAGYPQLIHELAVFGRDQTHSLYAFWLHEARSLASAPIVFLNTEGIGNSVLAGNLEEFVSLLTLGRRTLGMTEDWDAPFSPCDNVLSFRRWAKDRFRIRPPGDPADLVRAARSAHADFDGWIGGFLDHGGTA